MAEFWERTLQAEQDILYRKDRVAASYIDHLLDYDKEAASKIAEQLDAASPLNATVVIIPVAAHQEEHVVAHAIHEYGHQVTSSPFTLVLGFNSHTASDNEAVRRCIQNAEAAASEHPNVDIRMSMTEYQSPRTIGRIRYDLWNGVLLRALYDGTINGTQDVIALNHDIDLVSMPRNYISSIQQSYTHPIRSVGAAYSRVRHAPDSQFPNISRVTAWTDFAYQMQDIGYEAGAIIPMAAFYAQKGGFSPTAVTHEVGGFIKHGARKRLIPTGNLQTSPRRYIDRLAANGIDRIWTKGSFGTSDTCRDPEYISSQNDISVTDAHVLIGDHFRSNVEGIIYGSGNWASREISRNSSREAVSFEAIAKRLARTFEIRRALTSRALLSIAQAPHLNRDLFDEYRNEEIKSRSFSLATLLIAATFEENLIPESSPVVHIGAVQNKET